MSKPSSIFEFEQSQQIHFRNKVLLQQAFIHRSYCNERVIQEERVEESCDDNERLEFLGDAILTFLISEMLYGRFPDLQEGRLTQIRTKLVRKETLAHFASEMEMGRYLWLGYGEEESGGRRRVATLCDTFEAFLGALYLDQGIEAVRSFLQPRLASGLAYAANFEKDPKSRLQEWAQATLKNTPRYKVIDSSGPDHDKIFVIQVLINHVPYGIGRGRSKDEASQAAAAMTLHQQKQFAPEYQPGEQVGTTVV